MPEWTQSHIKKEKTMTESAELKMDQFEDMVRPETEFEEDDSSTRWIPAALKHIMGFREDEAPAI